MKILNSDASKEKRDGLGRWTSGASEASSYAERSTSQANSGSNASFHAERALRNAQYAQTASDNGAHADAVDFHQKALSAHEAAARSHEVEVATAPKSDRDEHLNASYAHRVAAEEHKKARIAHRDKLAPSQAAGNKEPDISKTRAPQGMTDDEQRAHLEKTFDESAKKNPALGIQRSNDPRWTTGDKGVLSKVDALAKKHLGIDTLEVRGRDGLDFHDSHVAGIKRALSEAYGFGDARKDAKIAEIAKEHFDLDTLETRGRDGLDFHDVGVTGVKRALIHAHKAGEEARKTAKAQTLDEKIASLKPGESKIIAKGSNGTHVTAERTGNGKTVRYIRHSKNTSEVIKQHSF